MFVTLNVIPFPHAKFPKFSFPQNSITVIPKIAHFTFGDEPSNYSDSASVQCLVTSGDLPIEFIWYFNERPIKTFASVTTAQMGKRNSVLTIDSVSDKHAGNFTCQATNSAASANFTSQLIVNGGHEKKNIYCVLCRSG